MAVDTRKLHKEGFWLKKLQKVNAVRDVNKDGLLSQEDFMIIVQRYKDMPGCTDNLFDKLSQAMKYLCDALGLSDKSTKISYVEAIANFAAFRPSVDKIAEMFTLMFEIIDTDESGKMSLDEWKNYYRLWNIDTKFAKASFDAMDTDGDGFVSKKEFYDYNWEFYYTAEDNLKSSILYGPLD